MIGFPASVSRPLLFFILVLFIALITLSAYPGIQPGEGPVLIAASQGLGISHAPGYPLYVQMSRLFSLVPIGSLALRHVLFSLIAGTIVCALLMSICRVTCGSAGIFAGAFFMTSQAFTANCLKAEVYALALVIFCLLLFFVRHWQRSGDDRWLLVLAFLSGLSCGHHLTIVMLLPVFVVCVGLQWRDRFSFQYLLLIVLFGVLGLSVLLYLPLRAGGYPLINWGVPFTFDRFVTLITAKEEVLSSVGHRFSLEGMLLNWGEMRRYLSLDLAWYVLVVAFFGTIVLFRRSRLFFSITVLSFLLLLAAVTVYRTNEREAFFLPGLCLIAVWLEAGIIELLRMVKTQLRQRHLYATCPLVLLSMLILIVIIGSHRSSIRQWLSDDDVPFFFEAYSRGIAAETTQGSIVLTERSSLYFMMLYNTLVEHDGEYVPIFDHLLSFPWYLEILPFTVPVSSTDDVRVLAENSREWNEAISAALLMRGSRTHGAHVLESMFVEKIVSKQFPDLGLIPRGFLFRVGGGDCSDARMSTYYQWLSDFSAHVPMRALHANFFAYMHAQQRDVLRKMGCPEESQQEHVWMNSLLAAPSSGVSPR